MNVSQEIEVGCKVISYFRSLGLERLPGPQNYYRVVHILHPQNCLKTSLDQLQLLTNLWVDSMVGSQEC